MKQLKLFGSSKIALSNFITHCVAVLIALIVVSAFGEGYLYHRSLGRRVPHTMTESSGSYPVVGPDSIMDPKEHGTCPNAVMSDLRCKIHCLFLIWLVIFVLYAN